MTEVDTFLAEPGHLVRIATVDADGMPRNVPLWFILHDGLIVFTPRVHSVLLANVRRDPRVGLTIDEEALPYRKLTVQGAAQILHEPGDDDVWRDLYLRIAMRYVPEDGRAGLRHRHRRPAAGADRRAPRRGAGVDVADAGRRARTAPASGTAATTSTARRWPGRPTSGASRAAGVGGEHVDLALQLVGGVVAPVGPVGGDRVEPVGDLVGDDRGSSSASTARGGSCWTSSAVHLERRVLDRRRLGVGHGGHQRAHGADGRLIAPAHRRGEVGAQPGGELLGR